LAAREPLLSEAAFSTHATLLSTFFSLKTWGYIRWPSFRRFS